MIPPVLPKQGGTSSHTSHVPKSLPQPHDNVSPAAESARPLKPAISKRVTPSQQSVPHYSTYASFTHPNPPMLPVSLCVKRRGHQNTSRRQDLRHFPRRQPEADHHQRLRPASRATSGVREEAEPASSRYDPTHRGPLIFPPSTHLQTTGLSASDPMRASFPETCQGALLCSFPRATGLILTLSSINLILNFFIPDPE